MQSDAVDLWNIMLYLDYAIQIHQVNENEEYALEKS